MERVVDFFDQIAEFLQYAWDLIGNGIENIEELPKIFEYASNVLVGGLQLVHPAFYPILAFALCAALLLRFLRLD